MPMPDLHNEPGDYVPPDAVGDYKALPRAIRDLHPYEGWQWLSEAEKGRLVRSETEPEA